MCDIVLEVRFGLLALVFIRSLPKDPI